MGVLLHAPASTLRDAVMQLQAPHDSQEQQEEADGGEGGMRVARDPLDGLYQCSGARRGALWVAGSAFETEQEAAVAQRCAAADVSHVLLEDDPTASPLSTAALFDVVFEDLGAVGTLDAAVTIVDTQT